jgi:DNA-binding transcriptional MerR regulator
MEYAQRVGPAVGETLLNLSKALVHLVSAASETGVSMLTLVNSFAKLVNAIPTSVLSTLLQFVVVFKAVKLAAAGMAAMGGLTAFATSIGAMRTAAAGATGPLASLGAAFGALSRTAKVALIGAGIGILVLALSRLSNIGKQAPPDIDRMTTALGKLGQTGKVTGEAARVFGKDFGDLGDALRTLARPSNLDKFQQGLTGLIGMDSTPVKDAKEAFDGLDKGLTSLVKGGKADLAAAALETSIKNLKKQGFTSKEVTSQLDDYKAALADQALEQQLAAQAMGIFGQAALDVQAKLDAQKQSADGLRASIVALNDANRSAYDAQIGFEASLDGLSAAFKKNGATLNLNTEAGRANGTAMSTAAKAQDEMIASGLAAGDSLGSMTKKSGELRTEMLKLATEAFDGNKKKAQEYVNTLLGAPGEIKTLVKLEQEKAVAGLKDVQSAIKKTPGAKTITVDTLNGAAIKALEKVGLKVKQLPNGKTQVTTKNGQALGSISAVARALRNLNGKTATTWTYHNVKTTYINSLAKPGQSVHDVVGATGGLYTGSSFKRGYADGGKVTGPGTGTSDDVFAPWLSNGEFVMKKTAVDKYGEKFLQRLNAGEIEMPHFAKGGKLTKKQQAAKAQAASEQQARHDAMPNLTVSHFGQMAGYKRSEFGSALAKPDSLGSLVNSLNEWRHMIEKMTHGATESKLLKALDSTGKKLLTYEKQLNSVNASLGKAKDKLNTLKDSASQLASSVKSGILGSANITRGASGDAPVTVSSIMGGLTQSRDKATAFASALKELQKKGLSASLIQQIAEAGVEGGGLETAGALLGASSSEIKSVNSLQGQINTAATSAGKTTADSVYAAAIKMQERTVKELTRQQQKLTTAMDKLTKAMEKAIEKAIGKKSAGGIVGAAASGGIRSGLTWVGEHGPELADLPVGSRVWSNPDSRRKAQAPWASMLNTPRGGGVRRAATPVGGGPVEVLLELRSSGSETDEFLLKILRRAIRVRGGNAQVVLTGRQA